MAAFDWAAAEAGVEPPAECYCATRDVAVARIESFHVLAEKREVPPDTSALLSAVAGELTNNCFDHNLGVWHDVSGCWFEHEIAPERVRIVVADRGQGFFGSLRRVKPDLRDHREALLLGFTAHLSGRAPEQRGQGLTFVLDSLAKLAGTDFQLQTGDARLTFTSPVATEELPTHIHVGEILIPGTYGELTFPRVRRTLASP